MIRLTRNGRPIFVNASHVVYVDSTHQGEGCRLKLSTSSVDAGHLVVSESMEAVVSELNAFFQQCSR